MQRVKEMIGHLTIRQKLTSVFFLTAGLIVMINLYMYAVINGMGSQVEQVYASNVSLNELGETLTLVQGSMSEYLNTKSSDSMEEYFRSEQDYQRLLNELNTQVTDDPGLLAEKNIRRLSESYLELVSQTVQAKRGRNVERYGKLYEEATGLYEEIHAFIYSLNNAQFKDNSQNYQSLLDSLLFTEAVSAGILVLVLLVNFGLILLSTHMITKPLYRLAQAADEVAKGNFQMDRIPIQSTDEVGTVTLAFNQMVESIRTYIRELKETLERENQLKERELMMNSSLKEAQLKYLQAQINPHFLFNTLNAGSQLAMMEDAPLTEKFLANTAEFFRYNVRKNDQDATIGEELRLVDSYIYILNVRFSGEIHFEKDVDASLEAVRVPSMILQPIVENAVNYGIRDIEREGRIELSVYQKDGQICISVWDNGAGMTRERIRQVMAGEIRETDLKSNSNGVGLKNVMERLRLYFGEEKADLEIYSEGPGMGTEVLITVLAGEDKHVSGYVGG